MQPRVSINVVDCYRTERALMGSVHPNSVPELTMPKVVGEELSLACHQRLGLLQLFPQLLHVFHGANGAGDA